MNTGSKIIMLELLAEIFNQSGVRVGGGTNDDGSDIGGDDVIDQDKLYHNIQNKIDELKAKISTTKD